MLLKALHLDFTICKIRSINIKYLKDSFFFIGQSDEEISLVCETNRVPDDAEIRDDGWQGFRIAGMLDFSLTGILTKISAVLSAKDISIFAVSTYNTDYFFVKKERFYDTTHVLAEAGYTWEKP